MEPVNSKMLFVLLGSQREPMCGLSNEPITEPHFPLNSQTRRRKVSQLVPFSTCSQMTEVRRKCQESTLAGCEVMQRTIVQLSSKPQMRERRSSTKSARSLSGLFTNVAMRDDLVRVPDIDLRQTVANTLNSMPTEHISSTFTQYSVSCCSIT